MRTDLENGVEVVGSAEQKPFSLELNAHAFLTLTSKIYQNKARAVVRELSCNAYDAHVDAGVSKPFFVHLPTQFENWFSIRDYGKGLSQEDMEAIYTTFFKSTKGSSNSFVGAFGLGCKSPFSISDNFTVISYHGGMKSTYACFIDDSRIPKISLVSQNPSDETGLEVIIDNNNLKCSKYELEAECTNVFTFFDSLPEFNIQRVHDSIIKQKELWTKINDELSMKMNKDSYSRKALAVMGNVAYEIPYDYWPHNTCIAVKFNIGDLSVNPGIETLSLDEKTKKALSEKIASILICVYDAYIQKIESNPTKWKKYCEFHNTYADVKSLFTSDQKEHLEKEYKIPNTKNPMKVFSLSRKSVQQNFVHYVDANSTFYIDKKGCTSRIKFARKVSQKNIVVLTDDQVKEINIDADLVNDPMIIILPQKVYSTSTTGEKFDGYFLSDSGEWIKTTIENNGEQKIYVKINRMKVVDYTDDFCFNVLQYAKSNGFDIRIYGINNSFVDSNKFTKGNWITIEDWVKNNLKLTGLYCYSGLEYSFRKWLEQFGHKTSKLSEMRSKLLESNYDAIQIARQLKIGQIVDLSYDFKVLKRQYPILNHIHFSTDPEPELIESILK
jgi:hypothetical protein